MRVTQTLLPDLQEVPPEDLPEAPSQDESLSGAPVPPEDMPDVSMSGKEVPPEDLPIDTEKYGTSSQQLLAGVEGLAQGYAGPVATLAEKGLNKAGVEGFTDQDIIGRRETNPWTFGAGQAVGFGAGVATGTGVPRVLAKVLPQVGSKAINAMTQMGAVAVGDEISNALLGNSDPTPAVVGHIVANSVLGYGGGKLFGAAEKGGLKAIENMKLGKHMTSFLSGAGHSASFPEEAIIPLAKSAMTNEERKVMSDMSFKFGQIAHKRGLGASIGAVGVLTGHPQEGAAGVIFEHFLQKALSPVTAKVNNKMGPVLLNAAKKGRVKNLAEALDHATTAQKGYGQAIRAIDGIFKAGGNSVTEPVSKYITDRDKTKEWIEAGGIDQEIKEEAEKMLQESPEGFAKGGKVQGSEPREESALATLWPEQNMMISAAKGRVSNYLNSQRPLSNASKLTYDREPDNKQKSREYDHVVDLANNPLSILNKVKSGSLTPKDMQHFTSMFPEVHGFLSKKMTEKIIKGQLKKDKKPSYRVRQAMSLFLGTNLDSSLSQPNMMAAQAVFAKQKAQNQAPQGKSNALSKAGQNAMTDEQARERRLNKS